MNQAYPDRVPIDYTDDLEEGIIYAMNFEDVFKEFGDLWYDIEFILTKVTRTNNATPILTLSGEFCIPGLQAFYNIFHVMNNVLRLFQKVKKEMWHFVCGYVKILEVRLKPFEDTPCFITNTALETIIQELCEYWRMFENAPFKDIRTVKGATFTADDLKNELSHIGVLDIFPELGELVDTGYQAILEVKQNADNLKTWDLMDYLESTLIFCFSSRFEFLNNLLEIQEGIHPKNENLANIFLGITSKPENLLPYLIDKSRYQDVLPTVPLERHRVRVTYNFSIDDETISEPTPVPQQLEKKTENCSECNDVRMEMNTVKDVLQNVQKQLKNMQQNSEQFETKLVASDNKTKNFEKQLEDERRKNNKHLESSRKTLISKNEQLEALKRRATALSNCQAENQTLKFKIAEHHLLEKQLNISNKDVTQARDQLSGQISELEIQLKSELKTVQHLKKEQTISCNLTNEITKLKDQIEREKLCSKQLEKEISQLRTEADEMNIVMTQSLEMENLQLRDATKKFETENASLLKTNQQLSIQNEEQKRLIQVLLEKQQTAPSSSDFPVPSTQMTDNEENSRQQLWKYQKIKDSFRDGIKLRKAEAMVKKLTSLNRDPGVHQMAHRELENFKKLTSHYLQAIEMNILKIKNNGSSDLEQLPEAPKFSDEFMRFYRNATGKQTLTSASFSSGNSRGTQSYGSSISTMPSTSSRGNVQHHSGSAVRGQSITPTGLSQVPMSPRKLFSQPNIVTASITSTELDDTECAICLDEMTNFKETIKCQCRRRFHLECATKWLNEKRECPTCRKLLLNPSDYPPLN
ncbi:RING-type domain-containing protein [Caenorhabditis elegans]|nr:RING-type domain-containing protein [Caenorhabditis elegans]CCD63917.2 RING-type domain-containing protein [Caenorhabditis elegans]|eukprot:NP_871695.2 Uncharacterized protein CELE_C09E7.8 [Caenorhabditis elegans]